MNFLWCTIDTDDMEESLKFYQEIVGLSIDRRFPAGETKEIVFLGDRQTKVELISDIKDKKNENKEGISLGFETDSLDNLMKILKEKGYKIEGPFSPNPRVRFIFTFDPNGVKIQFVENV